MPIEKPLVKPWLAHYDPGVPENIAYPEGLTLPRLLEAGAEQFPNRPAVIFPTVAGSNLYEVRLSYRDLDSAANRFANGLMAMGIQKGDRVALLLPNSPPFVIGYFGALKAGAVVIALAPYSPAQELEQQLVDCGAETVVTLTKFYPTMKEVQPNTQVTRVITTNIKDYFHPLVRSLFALGREKKEGHQVPLDRRDYSFRLILRHSSEEQPPLELVPEDIALLHYDQDAAGQPRAVALAHRNLLANCLQAAAWRTDAEPGREAALCVTPFSQLYAMQWGLLTQLFWGGALILFPEFDLEAIVMAMAKYRPTVFPGAPEMYEAFVQYPALDSRALSSLRLWFCFGDPLPDDTREQFESMGGRRVTEGYGLAEASPLTHANPIQGPGKAGSIGLPLPGTTARIVDRIFPTIALPVGQPGEMAVRGPQVFGGYWNRAADTGKALQEGWLLTGNLARMDEDGFFYLVERKKDGS